MSEESNPTRNTSSEEIFYGTVVGLLVGVPIGILTKKVFNSTDAATVVVMAIVFAIVGWFQWLSKRHNRANS